MKEKTKITHFKTGIEVSNDFYKLLEDFIFDCSSELQLVKNERSDASYQYHLWCPKCRN